MADDVMELEDAALGEDSGVEGEELNELNEMDDQSQEEGAELQNEGDESEGEVEESEGEQQEEQKPVENAQDGRKMPDAVKKAFANLKSSNPEAAKTLRATWFQNQDYKAVFPTPADAVALKDKFEMLGGEEGIAAIESERQEWQGIEKQVEEGKIADILAEQPEILAKNAVGMVNKWAEKAPEQYAYYANKLTYNKMGGDGTLRTLSSIHGLLADNPQAQQAIAEMHDHLFDMREKSAQFEQKRVDPREEQLRQERESFEEQRRADFEGQVYNDAQSYLKPEIDKAIGAILNGRQVSAETMELLREKVNGNIEKMIEQTPGLAARVDALYSTGDRAKSLDFIKQQYNRILTSGKAADIIKPFLRDINPTPATKQNGQQQKPQQQRQAAQPNEGGKIHMNGKWPNHADVDWSKTSMADYASGKAVLRSGKTATGWATTA
jgi:hypothetical protein